MENNNSIDGSTTDGSEIDGCTTDGSEIDGCTTDGSSMDGGTTDGSEIDGSTSDGSSIDGSIDNAGSSVGNNGTYGCNCGYKNISWEVDEILQRDELKYINDLMAKLLRECGWEDAIRKKAREIWERRDEDTDVYDVFREILPLANESLPQSVQTELEEQIRNILRLRFKPLLDSNID